MDLQLTGKTAFITGSTAGIGYSMAEVLAGEGCDVILHGRTIATVASVSERLQTAVPACRITGIAADFTRQEEVTRLAVDLPPVDILINNAGIFSSQSFIDTSDAEWQRLLDVNLLSGVKLSRACLPGMIQRQWGRILFVSSECAQLVPEDLIAYSTTKASLHALARGLAQTAKGTGVTVNVLMPGSTLSEGAQRFLQEAAATENTTPDDIARRFFSDVRTSSLLQRFATPREVAQTAAYYCSPLAAATSGAVIRVDGGSVPGIF